VDSKSLAVRVLLSFVLASKQSLFQAPTPYIRRGAISAPVATGFWDRQARPTCGRLRRVLSRLHFSELPLPAGQLRKNQSVTAHLPKGVRAHRRQAQSHSVFSGRLKLSQDEVPNR
jgi:hypothetical protein